jgi:hypothetical protein
MPIAIGCLFDLALVFVLGLFAIGIVAALQGCNHALDTPEEEEACWRTYQPPEDGIGCGSCTLEATVCLTDADGTETVPNIERLMQDLDYEIYISESDRVCFVLPIDHRDCRG